MNDIELCAAGLAACSCALRRERCDGRHLCECGGSWKGEASSGEDILILPISLTLPWEATIRESESGLEDLAHLIDLIS